MVLGELGLPIGIHPKSLETLNDETFLQEFDAQTLLAPFYQMDPDTQELFLCGSVLHRPNSPELEWYGFAPSKQQIQKSTLPLDYPCYVRSFGLTAQYGIVHLNPHLLNPTLYQFQGITPMESTFWNKQLETSLLILNRKNAQMVAKVALETSYCASWVNTFEHDNELVLDFIEYDRPYLGELAPLPNVLQNIPQGKIVRLRIDTKTWAQKSRQESAYRSAPHFPTVQKDKTGQPTHQLWTLGISKVGQKGRKFFDQLVRIDWREGAEIDLYQCPPNCYLGGEPTYIRDPSQTEKGWLLCQQYSAKQQESSFLLFDAYHIHRGPIAQYVLDHIVPFGLHSVFVETPK